MDTYLGFEFNKLETPAVEVDYLLALVLGLLVGIWPCCDGCGVCSLHKRISRLSSSSKSHRKLGLIEPE